MATLERRKDHFRIIFFYKNKRYAQSLHTDNAKEAETMRGGIEERLMRLNQNLVEVRPGADLVDYVVSGINLAESERPAAQDHHRTSSLLLNCGMPTWKSTPTERWRKTR